MTNLRNRKVGSCGLCTNWVHNALDWGHCVKITENSEIRGAVLPDDSAEYMGTRKDFGCRLFQEIDIWKN